MDRQLLAVTGRSMICLRRRQSIKVSPPNAGPAEWSCFKKVDKQSNDQIASRENSMSDAEATLYLRLLYRRAFAAQDALPAQVSFEAAVLDKYRGAAGFSLIRTNTVGRVKREGGWSIDLGIGEEGRTVHAALGDIMHNLPEAEREHWAQHAIGLPMSKMYLQMRLQPGSCFDDGELRPWD
jgi:hypothetical protein